MAKTCKVVTAGHSARVDGMDKLVNMLVSCVPGIDTICLGPLEYMGRGGGGQWRSHHTKDAGERGSRLMRKLRVGFRAKCWATIGPVVTGIKCVVTAGRTAQLLVINGPNLPQLKASLESAGFAVAF